MTNMTLFGFSIEKTYQQFYFLNHYHPIGIHSLGVHRPGSNKFQFLMKIFQQTDMCNEFLCMDRHSTLPPRPSMRFSAKVLHKNIKYEKYGFSCAFWKFTSDAIWKYFNKSIDFLAFTFYPAGQVAANMIYFASVLSLATGTIFIWFIYQNFHTASSALTLISTFFLIDAQYKCEKYSLMSNLIINLL